MKILADSTLTFSFDSLDLVSAPSEARSFHEICDQFATNGVTAIHIDCSCLLHVDSSGFGAMIDMVRGSTKKGIKLTFSGATRHVMKTVMMMGINGYVNFIDVDRFRNDPSFDLYR